MDNLNTQSIMKAGLAGAGVNIIVALLGFGALFLPPSVAIAGGLIACCGWALIPVGTGALYGYFTPGRETIGQAAIGGAISGIVAGLVYGIFNALLQGGWSAWNAADAV